ACTGSISRVWNQTARNGLLPHASPKARCVGETSVSYSTRRSVRGQRRSRHCRGHVVRRIALAFALLVTLASAVWRSIPSRFGYSSLSRVNSQNSLWLQGSARENLALLAGQSGTQPHLPESGRVAYRYSVVPGGVQGPDELERTSVRDQVVSAHFAGFDFHRAIVLRLNRPKLVYLSYRVVDHVFWTKEKVQLEIGRASCGKNGDRGGR